MKHVLVVDDEDGVRSYVAECLELAGHYVDQAASGAEALDRLRRRSFELVITDLRMPGMSGLELLEVVHAESPEVEFIVLTAHGNVDSAVKAMKLGAFDYVSKPVSSPAELRLMAARALERRALRDLRELDRADRAGAGGGGARTDAGHGGAGAGDSDGADGDGADGFGAGGFGVGGVRLGYGDPAMAPVEAALAKVARTDATVLLLGESGTGKEVTARAIHAMSARADAPFVAINCATLSDNLLESELFGHERGAFTGATARKRGRLELADGGTFFLDEVGELRESIQAKLLRVLQERAFERVGSTQTIAVDVRWIVATNRDLRRRIDAGAFRADLYHRLSVFPVTLPALRERPGDIAPLARVLLLRACGSLKRSPMQLSGAAEAELVRAPWPGNVRELANVLERAAILADGDVVEPRHLLIEPTGAAAPIPHAVGPAPAAASSMPAVASSMPASAPADTADTAATTGADTTADATAVADTDTDADRDPDGADVGHTLEAVERRAIERALAAVDGNRRRAAERLGIGLRTLYEKLKRYHIS